MMNWRYTLGLLNWLCQGNKNRVDFINALTYLSKNRGEVRTSDSQNIELKIRNIAVTYGISRSKYLLFMRLFRIVF